MNTASPTVSTGNSGAPRGSLQELLKELGACNEARVWSLQFATLAEAWKVCKRGDWMVWLAAKKAGEPGWPTRQEVVLATCACAAQALPLCLPKERRIARNVLAVTRRWARGKATAAKVRAAVRAVGAIAGAASAAYYATCYAVNDHAAYAAYSAASAASAARLDAARASGDFRTVFLAANAARDASLATSADICRRMLKIPVEVRS